MIAAVLVIPAPGDPAGLLREGPCQSRPPIAWRTDPRDRGPGFAVSTVHGGRVGWSDPSKVPPPRLRPGGYSDMYVYQTEIALVLAWGGEVVAEGQDRAARVLGMATANERGRENMAAGVAWYGAVGDGFRGRRDSAWKLHGWSSMDTVQFVGRPEEAWSRETYVVIDVPALADPPFALIPTDRTFGGEPVFDTHPLLPAWALGVVLVARGLASRVVLLDADGREVTP